MPTHWTVAKDTKSGALSVDRSPAVTFVRCHFARGAAYSLSRRNQRTIPKHPNPWARQIRKRRRELGLLQREVGKRMGVSAETVANWEKGRTKPIPSEFKLVTAFLGYDPTPPSTSLPERFEAKRRASA